jgi:hypothetical protein
MGIKNLDKMDSTSYETPTEVIELVRTSILENLQPDFYHTADEHTKSAIELHKKVFTKYPNFYVSIFADDNFSNYFLDAHRIIALPYLLQDEDNLNIAKKFITEISPTRLGDIFKICQMKELFGIDVPKSILRKLFLFYTQTIEQERGKEYVGFLGTKYAQSIHDIMAKIRIKRKHLSKTWQEVMDWVFDRKIKEYSTPSLREASVLRQSIKKDEKPTITSSFPKYVPFTVWEGYARQLGFTEKEIYQLFRLMSNNEVKRNLHTLEKHGILDKKKDAVKQRVSKVKYDLMDMLPAIQVLDGESIHILMDKGRKEYERMIQQISQLFDKQTLSIAVDASASTSGHTHLLDSDIQKKIANNEPIPKWAKIVQRETFNINILLAKIIAESSKKSKVYMFNESVTESELPETFDNMIQEIKTLSPSGGSNILLALQKACESEPDIAIVITDLNENVPFQGALKHQIANIAKKFKGKIIFLATDTAIERPETLNIDEEIKKHQLHDVFVIPVKKIQHVKKGFEILKLIEKTKKIFKKSKKKKKKVEA